LAVEITKLTNAQKKQKKDNVISFKSYSEYETQNAKF